MQASIPWPFPSRRWPAQPADHGSPAIMALVYCGGWPVVCVWSPGFFSGLQNSESLSIASEYFFQKICYLCSRILPDLFFFLCHIIENAVHCFLRYVSGEIRIYFFECRGQLVISLKNIFPVFSRSCF